MVEWSKSMSKSMNEWLDLAYNVHGASRDYFIFDEILMTPIKNLLRWVSYLEPKLKEIQKRQEADKLKEGLTGQRRQAILNRINKES